MKNRGPHRSIIGIDVGATKIAAGLVDLASGDVRSLMRIATRRQGAPCEIVNDIATIAAAVLKTTLDDVLDPLAVGIAVPELVDISGHIRSTWNFPLPDLVAMVTERTRLPLRVESDVRAAAFAEARFGAGRACDNFAYFSLGSGTSYTLCLNGRPYTGAHGFAIHFASSDLAIPTADRGGLSIATPEDFASGLGMERLWMERGGPALGDGVQALETLAASGDPRARGVIEDAASIAGRLIAQSVNMLDPEKIVLGGGLGCSEGLYRHRLEEHIRANIWERSCADLPIVMAGLGEHSGIIGAALAARAAI
ncbi:ROK family protein [Novacetimonas hansenii]|uniref:Glucokinase n=3 Tax=Novacetimonas hansenii TaxID=436 RepID=A0ABQ0SFP2_NOVHA|nr:ROK family protein [Novacetimonas hansenii]EFG83433.1 putative glucokinase [Novacetimonas hansenii ATCC 23769]GBQ54477.1 glucokinase [Novacetimonas hansenii NRIC 0243]GEC64071.1 glucokinase [Novacetimonas hansenii]